MRDTHILGRVRVGARRFIQRATLCRAKFNVSCFVPRFKRRRLNQPHVHPYPHNPIFSPLNNGASISIKAFFPDWYIVSQIKIQMPLKIGIAFYIQEGNNRAGPPHWALVAHPISYFAPDVMVFQIRQAMGSSWSLAHTVCPLSNTPTLLGVLHIAEISMTSATLNQFVAQFPATKSGDDPSGIPFWSCGNWVIKVLHHLSQANVPVLRLPVQTNLLHDHVSRRARTLRTAPKNPQDRFAVLPLDGYY